MKEKIYQNRGVKITVKSPLTPSRENLERVYDVCNKLFKDEEIFYQLGECKRRNMKAV
ncbi:MAG: hypothetical protein ACLTA8_07620 [Intestinibacter bartlettii]|uniref:hypothetical protein n=1 Tax=Intestinibacter bartlettii TaxID=261299 RepID=UPI00206BA4A2|nr:MAG TPA: hypothetical protein [Caudoviricetes sp.]